MSFRTASAVRNLLFLRAHDELCTGVERLAVTPATAKIQYIVYKRQMSQERRYYVYMLASKSRVLYVGVTGSLMVRVLRHKSGGGGSFTRKYRANRLVWYQSFGSVGNAIARETEIKAWRREKKVALILEDNRTWEDLAADWGKPVDLQYRGPAGEKQIPHG
jgi:putative endonuclease